MQKNLFDDLVKELSTECLVAELLERQISAKQQGTQVRMPGDAVKYLARQGRAKQESFFVLTLDGNHAIIKAHKITTGILNRSMVHHREVFRCALKDNAAAVIAAHNHPSGNLSPSAEDREVTNRLLRAGEVMGIPMLDHIIIARTGYYSFLEHGEV